jgi:hypothetical protein
MADTGTMVICAYDQPTVIEQNFHLEFDYYLSDPGEPYDAMVMRGSGGTLTLSVATTTVSLIGVTGGSTVIDESFDTGANTFGYFNKVKFTMTPQYVMDGEAAYAIAFTFNNTPFTKTITLASNSAMTLFANPMTFEINGFSGTQIKNVVFNEVSCLTLGAQAVQNLVFDSDDSTSLIYDHSGSGNDVVDTNNSTIILKNT